MPEYRLVAARDGDLIDETVILESREAADGWAVDRVQRAFDIEGTFEEFSDIWPETDGAKLDEIAANPALALIGDALASFQAFDSICKQREQLLQDTTYQAHRQSMEALKALLPPSPIG